MQAYALHDLSLVLEHDLAQPPKGLERLLQDMRFVAVEHPVGAPTLRLSVHANSLPVKLPEGGREALSADGFQGVESGDDFLLSDGASSLHIKPASGKAEARVAPAFFAKPRILQRNFWTFALMKLLRAHGVFTLHAAALVSPRSGGLLIVARPGSGKSTLAIGLVRRGWGYLSDDAVLLRREGPRVAALALRRHFYVDAEARERYEDLHPEAAVADPAGEQRHRLDIHRVFPAQYVSACNPRIVLFPDIDRQRDSALEPLDAAGATNLLLMESGPQLFDRANMAAHLALLRRLVGQCDLFRLRSGPDLHADPGALAGLLQSVSG